MKCSYGTSQRTEGTPQSALPKTHQGVLSHSRAEVSEYSINFMLLSTHLPPKIAWTWPSVLSPTPWHREAPGGFQPSRGGREGEQEHLISTLLDVLLHKDMPGWGLPPPGSCPWAGEDLESMRRGGETVGMGEERWDTGAGADTGNS